MLTEKDLHVGQCVWITPKHGEAPRSIHKAVVIRVNTLFPGTELRCVPLDATRLKASMETREFDSRSAYIYGSYSEANAERNRRVREYAEKLLASIGEGE